VGIDAAFSKPLACPRCGQSRKRIRSYEWSIRAAEPAGGWAAEIPVELESIYGESVRAG
jgi:hypothetical protein